MFKVTAQREPEPRRNNLIRDTSGGENPCLLAFCGLLVPNLSKGWGAVFH